MDGPWKSFLIGLIHDRSPQTRLLAYLCLKSVAEPDPNVKRGHQLFFLFKEEGDSSCVEV